MKSVVDRIADILGYVLAALLAALVLLTLWQVFARYVLGTPDPYSEEIIRIVLMWFAMLACAFCVHHRAHVGISFVADRLPLNIRQLVNFVLRVTMALFVGIVFIGGGWQLMTLTFQLQQTMPALGFPVGAVYAVLPLAGILILLFLLVIESPIPNAYPEDDDNA